MTDISPWFWLSLLAALSLVQGIVLWEMENETEGSKR